MAFTDSYSFSHRFSSDKAGIIDRQQVATFIPVIVSAPSGVFELSLPPATTSGIETGRYDYDVSATQPGGDRYYWLKGVMTVEETCSRN
jgi:hypothetical protein